MLKQLYIVEEIYSTGFSKLQIYPKLPEQYNLSIGRKRAINAITSKIIY